MEHMKNFDGIGNDFPWNNTRWSNFNNKNETITLDHYDSNIGPNSVLELPDSDGNNPTMDSDTYSNHPGFLGITWSKKKAEAERYNTELNKVQGNYPNSGSCGVLTDSLNRLDSDLAKLEASAGEGGKGARRVNERARKARNAHRSSVFSAQQAACAEAQFQQANQAAMFQQMAPQGQSKSLLSPTNLLIGGVVIAGLIFFIGRAGRKAPATS
tara:strand:+ start:75 stop:713 length:639 start_codon:yes stop_codon:yes gene_type:complete